MFKLLLMLFTIRLYARNNIFKIFPGESPATHYKDYEPFFDHLAYFPLIVNIMELDYYHKLNVGVTS